MSIFSKRLFCVFVLLFSLSFVAAAQSSGNDEMVTVPKKYVSAEGLQQQKQAEVGSWVGIGREVGIAVKEGLGAVVVEAERFGTTRVGNFVMLMVAWKIIGKDLLAVVLGVPLFIGGVILWIWSYRRMFLTRRILVKDDKANKVKEWAESTPHKFGSPDGRGVCAAFHGGVILAWCIAWIAIIFA